MALDEDVAAFRTALPDHVRRAWAISPMKHVPMIHACQRAGWSMTQLAEACSERIGPEVLNPGGIVSHRLRECANGDRRPAIDRGGKRFTQPKPWCGRDECDEHTRWLTDLDTNRIVGRCDQCWTDPAGAL